MGNVFSHGRGKKEASRRGKREKPLKYKHRLFKRDPPYVPAPLSMEELNMRRIAEENITNE
jgi:hypothetical protein